jgi:hypothetical protein
MACQKFRSSPAANAKGECLAGLGIGEWLQQMVECYEGRVAPVGTPHHDPICQETLKSVSGLGREATEFGHRLPLANRLHVERLLLGEDGPVAVQAGQALVIRIRTAPQGQ